MDQVSRHEIDRHEIGGQDIISFGNKLHYNAVCNFLNNGRTQDTTAKSVVQYAYCIIC